MTAVQCDLDRAVRVRAKGDDAALGERGEHRGVRVAEQVVPSARDHRRARCDRGEERRRGGTAAAVMRDLQEIGVSNVADQPGFGFALDVAGQERGKPRRAQP